MSWKELTASVINSLAWPLVVFLLAVLLRSSLIDLFLRLKKIKHKEIELEFEERVKEIESNIDAPPISVPPEVPDQLAELSSISPRAAVLESWILLEDFLRKKAGHMFENGSLGRNMPISSALKILLDEGKLDKKTVAAVTSLRDLRNQVVHNVDLDIGTAGAKSYTEAARELVRKLT